MNKMDASEVSHAPANPSDWTTPGGDVGVKLDEIGAEFVKGPASSTDNAIARWNGTGGDTLQDSGASVDDNGQVSVPINQGVDLEGGAARASISSNGTTGILAYISAVLTWTASLIDAKVDFDLGLNNELRLDDDSDTLIVGTADDTFKIRVGGLDIFEFTVSGMRSMSTLGRLDLDGNGKIIFDGDGDTELSSPSDDQIDFKTGGTTRSSWDNVGLSMQNNAQLDMNGGDVLNNRHGIREEAAAHTALPDDEIILCDATGAPFTVTLPTAASASGHVYRIKKVDSSANAITIDGNGSETIDGATTQALSSQYDGMTIVSDGTEWWITSRT